MLCVLSNKHHVEYNTRADVSVRLVLCVCVCWRVVSGLYVVHNGPHQ